MKKIKTITITIIFVLMNHNSWAQKLPIKEFTCNLPEGDVTFKVSNQMICVKFKEGITSSEVAEIINAEKNIAPFDFLNDLSKKIISLPLIENLAVDTVIAMTRRLWENPNIQFANPFLIYKDGTLQSYGDDVIVKIKSEEDYGLLKMIADSTQTEIIDESEFVKNKYVLRTSKKSKGNAFEIANYFQQLNIFEFAQVNFLRQIKLHTNDTFFNDQWSINNNGQYGGAQDADMDVDLAWNITTGSNNIKIAVIDMGVDLSHPDLSGALLPGYDATNGIFTCCGGASNDDAHGTACAGIIAATANNSAGITGICPNCKIIPIRIMYKSLGVYQTTDAWLADGISYAWQDGADILSNSWGGGSSSWNVNSAINDAVNLGRYNKGCLVFFSSGNDNYNSIDYPASNTSTIAVGATTNCDGRKNPNSPCDGENWGSNYGEGLDICAPGVKIATLDISGPAGYSSTAPIITYNNDYCALFGGTSAACPMAAGVMGLILSYNQNLTGPQARYIIEASCDTVGLYSYNSGISGQPNGKWSADLGYGRINAYKALTLAQSFFNPCLNPTSIGGCGISYAQNYIGGGMGAWNSSTYNSCNFITNGGEKIYSFIAPTTGTYSIQVTNASGYVDYMWKTGTCGSTGWNCIDDIAAPGLYGSMNWTAGVTYYILLDDENNITGTHTFYINCPITANPCSNITSIAGCGSFYSQTYQGGGSGVWNTSINNSCGFSTPGVEQIYSFVAPYNGIYSVQVTSASGYVDYQWKASSCGATGWNCIDDINSIGTFGSMNWTAGTTYYLLLDDENNFVGTHSFYIKCPCPTPSNNTCPTATTLNVGSTCNYVGGTSCNATNSNFGNSCIGQSADDDVFFVFTATSLNTQLEVQSSYGYDAVFQVAQGPCGGSMPLICCVNNTGSGGLESISLSTTPGVQYYIRVWHNGTGYGLTGDFSICVINVSVNCPDNYEPNDNNTAAYNLFPGGLGTSATSATIYPYITTATDQDWFKLNASSYGELTVLLTSLPADYNLALYSSSMQLITSSTNSSNNYEFFQYNYSNSTYSPPFYLQVSPANSGQYNNCDDYFLYVGWIPNVLCTTPSIPVPTTGSLTCPGPDLGSYPNGIGFGWNNVGSVSYDIEIYQYPFNIADLVYSQSCIDTNSVSLSNSVFEAGKIYAWRIRSTTDCNGCNSAFSAFYYFHLRPTILQSSPVIICNGSGININTATINLNTPSVVSYQWYRDSSGFNLPVGVNSPNHYVNSAGVTRWKIALSYTGSTIWPGVVTTSISGLVQVSINNTPAAPIVTSNTSVCEGNNLSLATPIQSGFTVSWAGPNNFTAGSETAIIHAIQTNGSGNYFCTVEYGGCISPPTVINVTVNPAPIALFTSNKIGNVIALNNNSSYATSYNWNFGDNQTSNSLNPTHTYANDGYYNLCLTANSNGCNSSSYCELIKIGNPNTQSFTDGVFAKLYNDTAIGNGSLIMDFAQFNSDSSYLLFGKYNSNLTFNDRAEIIKTDKNGNVLWARKLPASVTTPISVLALSNNLTVCYQNSNGTTGLMKCDSSGNKIWVKEYSNLPMQKLFKTSQGYMGYYSGNLTEVVIFKLDNSGNIMWQKKYSFGLYGTHTQVLINNYIIYDNSIYLCGRINDGSNYGPTLDGFLAKYDTSGNEQWVKYYGSAANTQDVFLGIAKDNSNNIYLSGYSSSNPTIGFITKFNQNGFFIKGKKINAPSALRLLQSYNKNNLTLFYGEGILKVDTALSIVQQKGVNKVTGFTATSTTLDNKLAGVGLFYDGGSGKSWYSFYKVSFEDSLCLDTNVTNAFMTNYSLQENVLNSTSLINNGSSSNVTLSTSTTMILDSSLCNNCNLTAAISINGNDSICSGQTTILNAPIGMANYYWSDGSTNSTLTVNTPGNYSVSIINSYGCSASSPPVTITVLPLPFADAGSDKTICAGTPVTIGTSTVIGNSYTWSPSTALSNTAISNPIANPAATTNYTQTVSNIYGCISIDSVLIVTKLNPTYNLSPTAANICPGNSINISASNNTFSYEWTPSSGLNATTGTSVVANPVASTIYTVIATRSNGCTKSKTISINVSCPIPTGMNTTGINSNSATLNWNAVSCGTKYKLQYKKKNVTGWTTINGIIGNTKSITGLLASSNYQWKVSTKCPDGSFSSYSAIQNFTTPAVREINPGQEITSIEILPNPNRGFFVINFISNKATDGSIFIYDALGNAVYSKVMKINEGLNRIETNLESHASGFYFVSLKTNESEWWQKFVKE